MHEDLIKDNLENIIESIELINERFSKITGAEDFVKRPDGILILDSVCMRLQIIGELVKKIDKLEPNLLEKYPEIEWPNIMKLRDIISHHYEQVDHEIIYDICKNHIPLLNSVLVQILKELSSK